jgi:hypothetical protein
MSAATIFDGSLSPEAELTVLLCRTPLSAVDAAKSRDLLRGPIVWERLLGLAAAWEVEPVMLHHLRTSFPELVPVEQLDTITDRERTARANSLTRALLTVALTNDLKSHGIDAIVLKGAALAITAYDDASMRSYSDVDLLLRVDDLRRAKARLQELGYKPDYADNAEAQLIADQHALEFSSSINKIELHWTPLSKYLGFNLDIDGIWRTSQMIPLAGSHIRAMNASHQLLFTCAHGTKHQWINPRWICDVAQLSARMSPTELEETEDLAASIHARRILALGIRLTRDVLGCKVQALDHAGVSEADTAQLIEMVRSKVFEPTQVQPRSKTFLGRLDPNLEPLIYWAKSRERLSDQIKSVSRVLFVPTERDAGLGFFDWVVRPFRLLMRTFRSLTR